MVVPKRQQREDPQRSQLHGIRTPTGQHVAWFLRKGVHRVGLVKAFLRGQRNKKRVVCMVQRASVRRTYSAWRAWGHELEVLKVPRSRQHAKLAALRLSPLARHGGGLRQWGWQSGVKRTHTLPTLIAMQPLAVRVEGSRLGHAATGVQREGSVAKQGLH